MLDGQLAFSLLDAYRQVNDPAGRGAARVTRTSVLPFRTRNRGILLSLSDLFLETRVTKVGEGLGFNSFPFGRLGPT
jgi:hypothetical protein